MFHNVLVKECRSFQFVIKRLYCKKIPPKKYLSKIYRNQNIFNTGTKEKRLHAINGLMEVLRTKVINHNARVTVIGSGNKGSPRIISLETDEKIYLFNCGDGCLNAAMTSPVSSTKMHHVFVTQLIWANISGIYGKTLTQEMSGLENEIMIHNASEIKDVLKFGLMFAEDRLHFNKMIYRDLTKGVYQNDSIIVEYVPLTSIKSTASENKGQKQYAVRKCHMKRQPGSRFGFVCLSKNTVPGCFVGNVERQSIADLAGLKTDDRLIEISGTNIEQFGHTEVIDMMRNRSDEIVVLTVDQACDEYCKDNGIVISSTMEATDKVNVVNLYDSTEAKQIQIKNLALNTSEETIKTLLGNRDNVEKILPPWTSNKGIAYITLKSREDATETVEKLHGMNFEGNDLDVKHIEKIQKQNLDSSAAEAPESQYEGKEKNRVYVGNLPYSATEEDIRDLLKDESIVVELNKNEYSQGYNIGSGFLKCKDNETAARVRQKLSGHSFRNRTLYIDQPGHNEDKIRKDVPPEVKPAIGYIIKFKESRPHVNGQVLRDMGIKPGPFIKKVLEGESVEVDGKLLTPKMLLQESEICRPFLVVDCPSVDYLDALLAADQYSALNKNPKTVPQLIAHISPKSVIEDPRYQQFIQMFNTAETNHLMLNEDSPCNLSDILTKQHLLFNKVHSELFPALPPDEPFHKSKGNIVQGVTGLQYIFTPVKQQGYSWQYVSDLSREKILEDALQNCVHLQEAELEIQAMQHKCREIEKSSKHVKEYPVITFLGTGSAQPSTVRSQSCILVETRQDEFIMLDCGEGALWRLYIMFGETKAEQILSNLKAVFISHLHFDHHGGLVSLALRRKKLLAKENRSDRLMLITPTKMKKWLNLVSNNVYNTDLLFECVPMVFRKAHQEESFDSLTSRRLQILLNVQKFTVIPVDHVIGSFGVYIEHADGWTMMYSGDTRPCQSLVLAGYNKTDYLIHEGTFANKESSHAFEKKHSTIEQAIKIGRQMKAKHIILTHFSQRYKHPCFEDFADGVAFAYDFMQLKPRTIPMVTHTKAPLALIFFDRKDINASYVDNILESKFIKTIPCKRTIGDTLEGAPDSKEQKLSNGIV